MFRIPLHLASVYFVGFYVDTYSTASNRAGLQHPSWPIGGSSANTFIGQHEKRQSHGQHKGVRGTPLYTPLPRTVEYPCAIFDIPKT